MTNYREILRLHSLGISNAQIAASGLCARQTVVTVLKKAKHYNLSWPLSEDMTNERLSKLFYPGGNKPDSAYMMPDCEWVYKELQRPNVTLSLLWYEYNEQCQAEGKLPYKLTQFKKYYYDYAMTQQYTMHIDWKPGDVMQVDWAGDTMEMTDPVTGEQVKLYLFVMALPCSGYTYAEPFLNMNEESWITANINGFKFFGGVTNILQCDNLKTGVTENTRSEVYLNKTYQQMAQHYNIAILPARIRKPRDKAYVENAVGVASTWIIAALRNEQFLTLLDAKLAVNRKLRELNARPYTKRGGTRSSEFERERLFLKPLPKHDYEISEWKKAIPQMNYHISVDKQNYSVPYEYVKQPVDVRITKSTIEVFANNERICSHKRLYGPPGQYSTNIDHMPKAHKDYLQWDGDRFREWARRIGSNTFTVVDSILSRGLVEQQGYKSCMSLLKLSDKYSKERLENACERALFFTTRPTYKTVNEILKSGMDSKGKSLPKDNSYEYGYVRGADYYENTEEDR